MISFVLLIKIIRKKMRLSIFASFISWASFASLMSLLIFVPRSRLGWVGPKTLIKGLSPMSVSGLVTYTDINTGYTHLAWCNDADGHIYHTKFVNVIREETTHKFNGTYKCQNGISIVSPANSKRILVSYTAIRRNSNLPCKQGETGGCRDIYYASADENGDSWTNPKQVSRKDSDDPVNRSGPQFFQNPATGRIWILYKSETTNGTATERDLRYVECPPGDMLCHNEATAFLTNANVEYGGYINVDNMNIRYIWTKRNRPASSMGITNSDDVYPPRWTNKESPWQKYCQDLRDRHLSPLVGYEYGKIISRCTEYNKDKNFFYVQVFDNYGKTLKNTIRTNHALMDYNATSMCTNSAGAITGVIYTTQIDSVNPSVGIISIPDGKLTSIDAKSRIKPEVGHSLECNRGLIRLIVHDMIGSKFNVVIHEYDTNKHFVETAEPISIADACCLKKQGYVEVILRALRSNGKEDTHVYDSAKKLANAGINPNFYATPCVSCKNAKEQAEVMCRLAKMTAVDSSTVYIDVTDPKIWTGSQTENLKFFTEFASMIQNCPISHMYSIKPGVISNKNSWETVMGIGDSGHSEKHLWYVNLDGNPDASDFVSFGGWTKPRKKTFKTGHIDCGHANLGLGALIN